MNYDKAKVEQILSSTQTVLDRWPGTRLYVACIAEDKSTAFAIAAEILKLLDDAERVSVEALTHPVSLPTLRGTTRLLALVEDNVLAKINPTSDEYKSLGITLLTTAHILKCQPQDLIIEVSDVHQN
jgi:hypothetical protein